MAVQEQLGGAVLQHQLVATGHTGAPATLFLVRTPQHPVAVHVIDGPDCCDCLLAAAAAAPVLDLVRMQTHVLSEVEELYERATRHEAVSC